VKVLRIKVRADLVGVAVCLCVLVTACGAPAGDGAAQVRPSPPVAAAPQAAESWESMARGAAAAATTTFGRAALEDGVVTRAEYEQSISVLVACGASKGHVINKVLRYGLYTFSTAGKEGDTAFRECTAGDVGTVQSIYFGEFADPEGRGQVVTAECLIRKGILPVGYRFAEATFNADMDGLLKSSAEESRARQAYEMCEYNPLDRAP